jgi:hypothetical protein
MNYFHALFYLIVLVLLFLFFSKLKLDNLFYQRHERRRAQLYVEERLRMENKKKRKAKNR